VAIKSAAFFVFTSFLFIANACGNENLSKLCSVNSLYLCLKFIDENPPSYGELLDSFPDAKKEGGSLKQLQKYLEARGKYCEIVSITEAQIAASNKKLIAFIL
jgi:hypothetical protein